MADPLRIPLESDFSVEPFAEPASPGSTSGVPELEPRDRGRRLVNAAETVGTTLGGAVGTIREKLRPGPKVVKKRSAEKGEEFTETIRDRTDRVKEEASRRLQQWSSTAQSRIRTLSVRTREFSRERPAEFILAIGGVAMIAGLILRLWRSNHD